MERIWQGDSAKSRWLWDPSVSPHSDSSAIAHLPIVASIDYVLGYHDALPCIGRLSAKLCMEKITVKKITSFKTTVY